MLIRTGYGLVGLMFLQLAGPVTAMDVATVPVGNPANPADNRYPDTYNGVPGFGAVAYSYRIGKYEVTAGQYTDFLNAVARTDTYGLYHPWMDPDVWIYGCGITRSGDPGNYVYAVPAGSTNRPVNYVSVADAMRFANWLHNGQPAGDQGPATTEDGAYLLNGATSDEALLAVQRKSGWKWALASEDEWYKAAYHKNNGVTADYWDYPTSSDAVTTEMANYDRVPDHDTAVGTYADYPSPYGTFDQGGNVWEWNDTVVAGIFGTRGGSFRNLALDLHASARSNETPTREASRVGFRVVQAVDSDTDEDGVPDKIDQCPATPKGAWVNRSTGCPTSRADLDRDGDVDQADFAVFQRCASGPDVPADPGCE